MLEYENFEKKVWENCKVHTSVELTVLLDAAWWPMLKKENSQYGLEVDHGSANIPDSDLILPMFALKVGFAEKMNPVLRAMNPMRYRFVQVIHNVSVGQPVMVIFHDQPPIPGSVGFNKRISATAYDDTAYVFKQADNRSKGIYLNRDIHRFITTGEMPSST